MKHAHDDISPLGAVMAFLYIVYIVLFPIVAFGGGSLMDTYKNAGKPADAFFWIGGMFMTVCGMVIFAATFIPSGAFACNPDTAAEQAADAEEAAPLLPSKT
jgi:hypothetical protein